MRNINDADIDGFVIRKHLAKFMTNYALSQGRKPDFKKRCLFSDMSSQDAEMQRYAVLACQLGMMGLRTDGVTPKDTFDPEARVDRAQFGTVLSRYRFGLEYAGGEPFYEKHLQALNAK